MLLLRLAIFVLSLTHVLALAGHHHSLHARHQCSRPKYRGVAGNVTASNQTPPAQAGPFKLVDKHSGKDFFDGFDSFTGEDPTHGLVDFVSMDEAFRSGLAYVGPDNVAVLAVDDKSVLNAGNKRKSVRISSKKTYQEGLIVLDINAMPSGCAVWPAFWTLGDGAEWPRHGEIDIIEGVNKQTHNQVTFHTTAGCNLDAPAQGVTSGSKAFLGNVLGTSCESSGASNRGCGIKDSDPNSYGAGVANSGGRVYVMHWTNVSIAIWNFNRTNTPRDITDFVPNPSTWPTPMAVLNNVACSLKEHFIDHQIIFDTTICGDWAGDPNFSAGGCPGKCADYVADPKHFTNAKWMINYLAVYQNR